MTEKGLIYYRPGDKPIPIKEKDELHVGTRIVDNISKFLEDSQGTALTVAITGEWGIGKTSVMNLLMEYLEKKNKNNIIIRFEPLLEGKLELSDIMKLFYLKLYTGLKTRIDSAREIIKKILSNLVAIPLAGTTIKLSSGFLAKPFIDVNFELNCGKVADKLLKMWDSNNNQSFLQATKDLNMQITEKRLNIFVFIDEIDRLPAKHIIDFLMFARILEELDNFICLVGIDYARVIQSLRADPTSGVNTYEEAKDYLDKLFQVRFDVNHNLDTLTSFSFSQLRRVNSLIFENILDTKDYLIQNKLSDIIEYLKTPRQIKKWATMVFIHKVLVEHYLKDIMHFLMLCAICIKHPIILDDLSSKTLPLLSDRNRGYDHRKPIEFQNRLLESVRVTDKVNNDASKEARIFDIVAYNFLKEILNENSIKASLLALFVRGYENETQVMVYTNYFEEGINSALKWLIKHVSSATLILSDLKDILSKKQSYPKAAANIELINELSLTLNTQITIGGIYQKYTEILIAPLSKLDLAFVTQNAHLNLLVLYIDRILVATSRRSYPISFLFEDQFLSEINCSEENISHLLQKAILRIEEELSAIDKIDTVLEEQINLIAILCHYIRWCEKENLEGKSKFLSNKITSYFISGNVLQKNKIFLIRLIFEVCAAFIESPFNPPPNKQQNPLCTLFDGNPKLIEELIILKERTSEEMLYYEQFKQCVTQLNEISLKEAERPESLDTQQP